ncbi:MAG TPA: undecaprenyl-diphosphatase UppP [Candidatus Acidoferrales bacterium]
MPLYQAVILALVQAVTEFLPISSTAHLFLFPWLLGWEDPGLTYTIVVHAGTLVGIVLYFFRTWLALGLTGLGLHYPRQASDEEVLQSRRMFWYIVAGTIPAAIAGVLLESYIETTFRSVYLMGSMLIGVGLLMWYAETRVHQGRAMDTVTLRDALAVGAAQAIALIPGVSRSGITITTGLFLGLSREAAARFTFLLSTPIIAGASAKKLLDLRGVEMGDETVAALLAGFVVSAVAGYAVIAFLLRYLQTRTLRIFIYYRIVFGIIVLLLAFLHGDTAR